MAGEATITIGFGFSFELPEQYEDPYDMRDLIPANLELIDSYDYNESKSFVGITVKSVTRSGDPQENFDLGFQKLPTISDISTDDRAALADFATENGITAIPSAIVLVSADG